MERYQDINARTIDGWVDAGWEWGKPIDHETYCRAAAGEWDVLLTPCKAVPHEWLGELKGKKLLGLACGGGQQMPVFAALGAECTVLDYSQRQLDSEKLMAEREGYDIRIIRADMTQPLPFEDEAFDVIFHPVSNCYIREVQAVWEECWRVLRPGGVLLAGLDNGLAYAFDEGCTKLINRLPFDPVENPEHLRQMQADNSGMQFSHTVEEQLDGQIRAGFALTHIWQDVDTAGNLAEHNVPSYYMTRAVKAELTASRYQKEAMALLNPAIPRRDILLNAVMGLCGESGEAVDLLKKHLFQGHDLDREKMIKELGDVAWYLAEAAEGLGVPLEEILRRNLDKLHRRYPQGFSEERSKNREKEQ